MTVVVRGVPLVGVIVRVRGGRSKVAVTFQLAWFTLAWSTIRLQVPEPLQSPLQPLNLEPPMGLWVKVTGIDQFAGMSAVQVPVLPFRHSMPQVPVLVTLPSPAPVTVTLSG